MATKTKKAPAKKGAKKVIIRAYSSGVHFGELEEYKPQYGTVKLKNSRRLWRWYVKDKKGISLSDVALHGIGNQSRVSGTLPSIEVAEVIEIIPVSDEAASTIEAQEVATA